MEEMMMKDVDTIIEKKISRFTTIRVLTATRDNINGRRNHPRETYDEIIIRSLKEKEYKKVLTDCTDMEKEYNDRT
jgi:hypothetical protein